MSGDDSLETILGTATRLHPDLPVEVVAGTVEGCRMGRLVDDSRRVMPGEVFVARRGTVSDGAIHIEDAIERGAGIVIAERASLAGPRSSPNQGPIMLACEQPLELGVALAKARRGDPGSRLAIAGVTGTNGKTTVTTLLRQVLGATVGRCGSIGTIETHDGQASIPSRVTTPGRLELVELLGDMVDNGCRCLAMEASSHALDQDRVVDLDFAVAVFTNLSGDHLDYHGTMRAYAEAKASMFKALAPSALAVVNLDDPASATMLGSCGARSVGISRADAVSRDAGVDRIVRVETLRNGAGGMRLRWTGVTAATFEGDVPLVGEHNAFNATAALLVAIEMGATPIEAIEALQGVEAPRGRLEPVHRDGDRIHVFVDYAHTDDAIRTILAAVRPFVPEGSDLVAVIGAGGDRDRTKRPRMMRAALDGADRIVVTSDNPRTEDPDRIVAEVVAGATDAERRQVVEEVDRRRAIARAVEEADEGDVIVIAGKGHEDYQIIGHDRRPFDDREIAREALVRRRGRMR